MEPKSLQDIAIRKVAMTLLDGKAVQGQLCPKSASKVFKIIAEKRVFIEDDAYDRLKDILPKIINADELDFSSCHTYMDNDDIELLQKQTFLKKLKFGRVKKFDKYINREAPVFLGRLRMTPQRAKRFPRLRIQFQLSKFNIVEFLEDVLNDTTQQNLVELDLKGMIDSKDAFLENWITPISQILPSLTTLKIRGHSLSHKDFLLICQNFSRLTELDISSTGLVQLNGITALQNLESLSISNMKFHCQQSIEDIYNLNNLTRLSIKGDRYFRHDGVESNFIELFTKSEQRIKQLIEVDFYVSELTDAQLKQIIRRHPTLKKVIANFTNVELVEIRGIELYTNNTLASIVRSLEYFIKIDDDSCAHCTTVRLFEFIGSRSQTDLDERSMCQAVKLMHSLLIRWEDINCSIRQVRSCCYLLSLDRHLHFYGNLEKRLLIDCVLFFMDLDRKENGNNSSPADYWKTINSILQITPSPNAEKIVSRAIEYLLIADGKDWELPCLEAIDMVMEKADSASEFYENFDKEKVVAALKKINKNRKLDLNHRRLAKKVLGFVETSF